MTEPTPSKEALAVAEQYEASWESLPFDLAREIDALTAATMAKAKGVIQAARSFCGESENCLPCKGREAAIAAYDAADRPAPEGAAPAERPAPPQPLRDAAREALDNFLARKLATHRVEPIRCHVAPQQQDSLRGVGVEQPNQDTGKPGCGEIGTPNTDAAQEKAPEVSESCHTLVNEMQTNPGIFNRPMVDQMTKIEDEPTQTVAAKPEPRDFTRWRGAFRPMPEDETWDLDRSAAAPGPTAGDVERARVRREWAYHEAAKLTGLGASQEQAIADMLINACKAGERSACAQLLAQIREPSGFEQIARAMLADIGCGDELNMLDPNRRVVTAPLSSADFIGMAEAAMDALADKLTEAK